MSIAFIGAIAIGLMALLVVMTLAWRATKFVFRLAVAGALILIILGGALIFWWYTSDDSTSGRPERTPSSSNRRPATR